MDSGHSQIDVEKAKGILRCGNVSSGQNFYQSVHWHHCSQTSQLVSVRLKLCVLEGHFLYSLASKGFLSIGMPSVDTASECNDKFSRAWPRSFEQLRQKESQQPVPGSILPYPNKLSSRIHARFPQHPESSTKTWKKKIYTSMAIRPANSLPFEETGKWPASARPDQDRVLPQRGMRSGLAYGSIAIGRRQTPRLLF